MKEIIRTSVVCIFDNKLLSFKAQDPLTNKSYFFLPGGKPEQNESLVDCAIRETLEETSYTIKITNTDTLCVSYPFTWNGEQRLCHTHFFKAQLNEAYHPPKTIKDANYHMGIKWVPLSKIKSHFSYQQKCLEAIKDLL